MSDYNRILHTLITYYGMSEEQAVEELNRPAPVVDDVVEDVRSDKERMLDVIYAQDKETGLPCGDYAIYLSDKTNPEIRDYILRNLLNELPSSPSTEGLDDEVVMQYTRQRGESSSAYAERITNLTRDFVKDERIKAANKKKADFIKSQQEVIETV